MTTMKQFRYYLSTVMTLSIGVGMGIHGPIAQWKNYHGFADQTLWLGIPHALDVLSNLGFLLVGLLSYPVFFRSNNQPRSPSFYAYAVFLLCIIATFFGSAYYHWAPDNGRLFWDRLPIALACASLLAAVRTETMMLSRADGIRDLLILCVAAVFSVIWWQQTEDLRPYLGLQIFTLLLIPIWQTIYPCASKKRWAFALAIVCYVAAKIVETYDAFFLQHLHLISGHSLKHLFAALAAGLILRSAMADKNSNIGPTQNCAG